MLLNPPLNPEEELIRKEAYEQLENYLLYLDAIEVFVLRQRIVERRTGVSIGDEISKSRDRIYQIEHKAIGKLRHPSMSRDLRQYLYEPGVLT